MRSFTVFVLASTSAAAIATAAAAQPAEAPPPEVAAESATLGEIVVTARRRSESLQQVPQSVTAITADTLQKLNLQDFDDIGVVAPGLSLQTAANGFGQSASLRGVSFQQATAASPTVAFYLNDAPVETPILFQSMFDIGQVEVLRGPQGTTRGISAPSGAITLTARRPVLSEYGGYISATLTDLQSRNVQGAINIPIIRDVLGLRVAGLLDQNDLDGVRSVNDPLRPRQVTSAIRASVAFEPSDTFNAYVSYMHLDKEIRAFNQVAGPGRGYNGPSLEPSDRLAVNDERSHIANHVDVVTAQIDSRLFGQHLSYVGSYSFQKLFPRDPMDRGNLVPAYEVFNVTYSPQERTTHEIRLASEPAPGRFLDYTVGAFYSWTATDVTAMQPRLLPGFFGDPRSPSPSTIFPQYQTTTNIISPSRLEETSFFGSVTAHLGENTELSVGGRQIIARVVRTNNIFISGGASAVLPAGGVSCAAAGLAASPIGAGVCERPQARSQVSLAERRSLDRPFIYNVALSHRFSRDLLVYANHGTSWRYGPQIVGITNGPDPDGRVDPVLASLQLLPDETSRSYEVGLKSTLLDGRMRFNVALYRQTFRNLFKALEPIRYISVAGGRTDPNARFGFTAAVPAVIEGIDIDTAFQVTPAWNVTAALSYADGRIQNAEIPCNAPIPAGQRVALCSTNSSTSRDPYWNATITSEYSRPLRDGVQGFVRGLFQYYPENTRRSEALVINPYSLMNLYAGLRSDDGAWEISLFAKNAFKTEETLSLDALAYNVSGSSLPFTSGYFGTTFTPRREVGVSIRYAFGSR